MRIAIALVALSGLGLAACDGNSDRVLGQAPGMEEPAPEAGPESTPPPQDLVVFVSEECLQSPEARNPAPLGGTGFGPDATPEATDALGSAFDGCI